MQIARRRGMKKAIVALARRLAVIMLGQQQINKTDRNAMRAAWRR
jgi:hypothetical protein